MSKPPVVCDTTVLLYLGRVGQTALIPALFEPVYVPEQVAFELDVGRMLRADTFNARTVEWIKLVDVPLGLRERLPANRLGIGEQAVMAYAQSGSGVWVGLDDAQARGLARQLGLSVVGTVGILIRAKREGLITQVRSWLEALQREGFRLSPDLYQEALRLADELEP